jgi:FkbM family methyltransferase
MKKVAFYIGANRGYGLRQYILEYDEIHVFEPDPEMFFELKSNFKQYPNLILNNCACHSENGKHTLYVTENRVSTSLAEVDTSTFDTIGYHSGGKPSIKTFEVNTVNLFDYFKLNRIDEVEFFLTDAQGSDLAILKTIKPYLDQKKIKKLFCETHNNNKSLYLGMDNSFDGFKEILEKNYQIMYYNFGGEYKPKEYEINENDIEWDTCWELK